MVACPGGAPGGTSNLHLPGSAGFGNEAKYAARSAPSWSLSWLSAKAGMMPHGWRTARNTCTAVNPRPARSGPKPPSPAPPWQFLQSTFRGATRSQYAFPAAGLPAVWAETPLCASGRASSAKASFFMDDVPPLIGIRVACRRLLADDPIHCTSVNRVCQSCDTEMLPNCRCCPVSAAPEVAEPIAGPRLASIAAKAHFCQGILPHDCPG